VRDAAFTDEPFRIHNRWIETEFDNRIEPYEATVLPREPAPRERITVEVGGRRLEVVVPATLAASPTGPAKRPPGRRRGAESAVASGGAALTTPMQGTIVKVAVQEGEQVEAGQLVVVLEAMKMEQPLNAHKAGTVKDLAAAVGAVVQAGDAICEIAD
jgi:acetyl-CoA/propionyl-CoA carboxylase biotin carboxyl carrier protein